MTNLTDDDLAAIRQRAEGATPGPWVVFDMDDEEKRKGEPLNGPGEGWYWVWSEPRLPYYGAVLEPEREHAGAIGSAAIDDSSGGPQEQADAEFIAHARTDVPALLAALDEARESADERMRMLDEAWAQQFAAESALAAVRADAFSEDAQAVLFGVTGTHPETYGGVTKDEALECAGDVLTRIRAALAIPTTADETQP